MINRYTASHSFDFDIFRKVSFREQGPNPDDDGPQTEHGECVANSKNVQGVCYAIFSSIMLLDFNSEHKM